MVFVEVGNRYTEVSEFGISAPNAKLSTEMNMLAKKAVQNPEILKPRTRDDTINNSSALITKMNNPSVTNVSGSVRITSSGLMIALENPSSSAETIRDDLLEKRMPLKTRLATHREKDVMPHWIKNSRKCSTVIWPRLKLSR